MVNALYPKLQQTAARLIAKFGQAGAIRRTTTSGPAYDPETVTTDHACQLAVMQYTDDKIDGTLIMRGDKLVYLSTAGLSIEPSTADKVVIGGEEHAIVNVKPLSPAGLVVFWEAQARQ
ncbi:hypothetical protein B5M44_19150 [Shinella sumterensis]|jgi:hypothetical protein|uniref:hypothetical protein n=1 Tax=Shinella sumterensis TaxID=1967501 RepID=UPI00106E6E49|nr:hypothetical protein [Shinella sumterensis]MCD1266067.1 hypothetical protein [Shinella sumterensis]TFE96556.1 hypothetical protein B5M44_19150 [Shinella sumterensis]